MDPRTEKLAIKVRDANIALLLVQAGYDSPAKIRAASDKDLKAVPGVGQVGVKRIREKLPKRK